MLEQLVAWNVRIKAAVVMADPFEKGVRALLNYGHTFGHAIEVVRGYTGMNHGEAVALGMIAAARMAAQLGKLTPEAVARIERLIAAAGLPTSLPGIEVDAVVAAMGTDKKVSGGKVRFVLPTAIGHAEVASEVAPALVQAAVEGLGRSAGR